MFRQVAITAFKTSTQHIGRDPDYLSQDAYAVDGIRVGNRRLERGNLLYSMFGEKETVVQNHVQTVAQKFTSNTRDDLAAGKHSPDVFVVSDVFKRITPMQRN